MSFSVDVNVLVYASDATSPRHPRARAFLEECARGSELFCLSWLTLLGYLRIATHPSIFPDPLSPAVARENVDALLRLPHVRVVTEEEGFWDRYTEISARTKPRGNGVPDAHLATILLQNGVDRLYSNDADFRRFDFLEVRNPFE